MEEPNFQNQKQAEEHYKDEGWDIIHPKLTRDRENCKHIWEKVKENDYQCKKCLQGFIGIPGGVDNG